MAEERFQRKLSASVLVSLLHEVRINLKRRCRFGILEVGGLGIPQKSRRLGIATEASVSLSVIGGEDGSLDLSGPKLFRLDQVIAVVVDVLPRRIRARGRRESGPYGHGHDPCRRIQ